MLSWLKNMIGATPKLGSAGHARGMLAQACYEAYKLARRDRPRERFQPHAYSGDAAILSSSDMMNRRTRDMVRNTAQGKRIVGALVDLVVGTGMQTYSWPFAPSEMLSIVTELESLDEGVLGPRLTYALESDDLFAEWSNDASQIDVEGRLAWPEMQRMLLGESITTGTGLLVRVFRKNYSLVPLAYQILEAEQLDQSMDRPAAAGKNRIVGGRELDADNRVVAYHVFLDDPGDFFGASSASLQGAGAPLTLGSRRARIPAERVIDLALFHRPSASGGVSWMDACGQTIWDRDGYVENELRSAAIDAAFALVAHLKDAEMAGGIGFADDADETDRYGNTQYKIGHSAIAATMGTDERLEMVRQTRPNKDAGPFISMLDRDTASSTGLSYFTLTGDYTNTTFTSTRGAKLDEELRVKPLHQWFAYHVALRIRREFNAFAAAGGLFTSITPQEFRRNARTYQRFDAIGNGRDLLDPYKEGEARTNRLRTCMSTFKEECAKAGKHWIHVLMQVAIERKVGTLFGVPLDFGTTAGAAGADQQAEEISNRVAMLLESN